jgi:cytochrome b
MTDPRRRVLVWDLPTRLCHWAIAGLFVTSWLTAEFDYLKPHMLSGYAMLALLIFRFAWGFTGSESARFARFLAGPRAVASYLRTLLRREADGATGHNPAGGWMVVAMLALLTIQAGTGLGANDDLIHEGPLAKHLGKSLSDRVTAIHHLNFTLLLAAVVLHLGAILAYRIVKRHDLVGPMISGRKLLERSVAPPRMARTSLAAAIFLAAAGAVWLVAAKL